MKKLTCGPCGSKEVSWSCESCNKDLCTWCSDRPTMSQSKEPIYCPACRSKRRKR